MQVKVDGKRNITLDFEAPKKFKLLQDGKEIPYLRTGKNSFRLSRNIDGVLDLEEIIEQPKIVKPMQLQAQQMALVNPNDVLMINQAAQQLEVEQNILGETQKRVEQTQAYLDVQQQRINETVLGVQGLETSNAERITATENGLFNLAGNLAKTEQNLIDGIEIVNNGLQEHKNAENPHGITKKTIGLDKVDNTSDMDKPISKAVQNALDEKADKDEIQAIRDELGEYQEKNDRFTNALSNYTGGLAYSGSDITIDDMLSTESENPVQNKVITNALNEKADISDIPTVNNATLTIQKNGTSAGAFSANASEDVNINLIIPTTAADVNALPDSTKYGAGLSLTINSTNYVMTAQLKDQDGNNLGTAQTIDLPLESVVVSGSYDSVNKKIVLTLQNGTTIDIPVGDLISGLQTEITVDNKLNADLVDDSTSTNKFVTASDITTWNGKQDTLTAGTNITIEEDAQTGDLVISSTAQESFFRGNFNEWSDVPTDTSLYQEDIHGNRVPKDTDFIIVEDASQFVPSGDLMHKLVVENLAATEAFTIRITDENGVSKKYFYMPYQSGFVAIDDYYSLRYQPGNPGRWYIKTNDGSPIVVKGTTYQSGSAQLCTTNDPATPFDAGMPPSAGEYTGAWRFAYYGVWATDGRLGWTPQYNIESTLPIANETTFGIAKLYNTTGQNTDGSMTQKSITDSLTTKQDVISDLATIRSGASAGATAVQPSDLATVATSGDYDDLINKPTIPTATSDLTNDSGFITSSALTGYATENYVDTGLSGKQDTLVSGTNIKTINNESILGSGNIDIQGGSTVEKNQLSWYGTCNTATTASRKNVVCPNFATLEEGVSIRVKFTHYQGYNGEIYLNVNGTGAKPIKMYGTTNAVRYSWLDGEIVSFTYDGTNWVMEDAGIATTSYYGYTKLTTDGTSTSTQLALAPAGLNNYAKYSISGVDAFSTSETYAVGDRVRYENRTYECITAITTAGAWDASYWQALDPLQTQIDNIESSKQDTLVSGTNIKTINNSSVLGSGNLSVGTVKSVNNTYPDSNGDVALTLPTVNDSTITLTQGGITKGSFTLNQASGATIALDAGSGGSYTAGTGIDITSGTISVTSPTLVNKNASGLSILGNTTSGNSTAIGKNATASGDNSIAISGSSFTTTATGMISVAIGAQADATNTLALALGGYAKATGYCSIQIGYGTNTEASSLYVGTSSSDNWKLLGSDGLIPAGRIPISTSVDSTSTNSTVVGAKLFYDTCGDIETLINAL